MMTRRTFLCGLTPATLVAPLAVVAQQAAKAARRGYLSPTSAAADTLYNEAFRQRLRALGYVEGQNILKPTKFELVINLKTAKALGHARPTRCDLAVLVRLVVFD